MMGDSVVAEQRPQGRTVAPRRTEPTTAEALEKWGNTTSHAVTDRKTYPPTGSGHPPISVARAALNDARRYRAEHLVAVAEGLLSPLDVIVQAATEEGRPLRRISLRQLLLSQPGWGPRRTDRFMSALTAIIGKASMVETPTVSWLIDPRAGGRRFFAWLDVNQKKNTPWRALPLAGHRKDSK